MSTTNTINPVIILIIGTLVIAGVVVGVVVAVVVGVVVAVVVGVVVVVVVGGVSKSLLLKMLLILSLEIKIDEIPLLGAVLLVKVL